LLLYVCVVVKLTDSCFCANKRLLKYLIALCNRETINTTYCFVQFKRLSFLFYVGISIRTLLISHVQFLEYWILRLLSCNDDVVESGCCLCALLKLSNSPLAYMQYSDY